MTKPPTNAPTSAYVATLVVRRVIRATPEKLFAAWTEPAHLVHWWGPDGVACPTAEVDLRPGGGYRIANRFPDGNIVWSAGVFEVVERPTRLIYTWQVETLAKTVERVTVSFVRQQDSTEVVVTHERIADAAARTGHENGWNGCLNSLERYIGTAQ
jgi:uncharacterized protein YndB with AHSA1/START domain